MLNFNQERLGMSAGACGYAKVCLDEAIAYARERYTFGKPLIANQVVRHRLVDMAMRINAVKSTLELLAWRVSQGEKPVAEICMLKNLATSTMEFCQRGHAFGGAGYLRGAKVERIYRETKVMAIGGGSVEIMKDLAAARWDCRRTMTSPFSDPDQRIAFFQQWFSDTIPHSKALGLKIIAVRRGFGSMQLEWREELVGNPETGVLAGGPLTALMDSCCGMSVATMLTEPALRDARPAHRLCAAGDARQGGDRRGRVLSRHPLGRLHARLRPSRRSQGSDRGRRRHLHAGHQGEVTRPQSIGTEVKP